MSGTYSRLPTSPEDDTTAPIPSSSSRGEREPEHALDPSDRPLRASVQAEFSRPPPATWKRVLLLVLLVALGWASVRLGKWGKKPEIIYASR
jgi:hypothetical protein